jgi:hypothetical protein
MLLGSSSVQKAAPRHGAEESGEEKATTERTNLGDRRWIVDGEVDPGATAAMAVDIFNPHANESKLVPKSGYRWRIGGRGGSAGGDLGNVAGVEMNRLADGCAPESQALFLFSWRKKRDGRKKMRVSTKKKKKGDGLCEGCDACLWPWQRRACVRRVWALSVGCGQEQNESSKSNSYNCEEVSPVPAPLVLKRNGSKFQLFSVHVSPFILPAAN